MGFAGRRAADRPDDRSRSDTDYLSPGRRSLLAARDRSHQWAHRLMSALRSRRSGPLALTTLLAVPGLPCGRRRRSNPPLFDFFAAAIFLAGGI